jgi:carbonic anhydrase
MSLTLVKGGSSLNCALMEAIKRLVEHNQAVAGELAGGGDARPALRLAIVTCMDARLDLFSALGLALGEAHIVRNAGGVVTDDVIRSLAISQRALGTREVMVIQHTGCGMLSITEDEFRAELARDAGVEPPFDAHAISDLEAGVRESVRLLRSTPFLAHRDAVRGFVYDVEAHRLREVQ